MFQVERVINNNVIAAVEDGREVILTGRGLGFGQRPGSTYDPARVERRFVLDDDRSAEGFTSFIAELPYELLVLSNRIADHLAASTGITLSNATQLALADHIQFAIQRLAQGQRLSHPLLWELKSTYRREFTAALELLDLIREATGVVMPVDEAGFITMHLVNAELTGATEVSLGTASAVQDIVGIVRAQLGVALDPESVGYARFLTHVKFAVQRIEDGALLAGHDSTLFDMVREQDPTAYATALRVADYVRERYDLTLPEEELLYLMVHVNRLRARDGAG
ncbi:MAG TPA: PRD domain-containing protein [Candidatus Nanopelagicales bacterium]